MQLGTLSFNSKEFSSRLCVDRLSVDSEADTLMAASITGPQTSIKAFTASLNLASQRLRIEVEDMEVRDSAGQTVYVGGLYRSPAGYEIHRHKLPYKLAQAVVFARVPGLLRCVSRHALWNELRSTQFTTPLRFEWIEWLERQLEGRDLLRRFPGCRMQVGLLTAETQHLDELVSDGLRKGRLRIT